MAATAWAIYGPAQEAIYDGTIDLDTDAFRMVLLGTGYTPAQTTHNAFSDMSANQISGTGYTANGKLITQTVTRSGLVTTVDCDDQSWPSSTLTNVAYAAIVRDANADGTLAAGDIPLFFCELDDGSSVSTTNSTLSITISASGLYTFTAATAA